MVVRYYVVKFRTDFRQAGPAPPRGASALGALEQPSASAAPQRALPLFVPLRLISLPYLEWS